jgi:hypothetical protein
MIMDGGDKPMMTTYLPKIAFTFQTRFKYSQGRNKRDTDSTLKGKKKSKRGTRLAPRKSMFVGAKGVRKGKAHRTYAGLMHSSKPKKRDIRHPYIKHT